MHTEILSNIPGSQGTLMGPNPPDPILFGSELCLFAQSMVSDACHSSYEAGRKGTHMGSFRKGLMICAHQVHGVNHSQNLDARSPENPGIEKLLHLIERPHLSWSSLFPPSTLVFPTTEVQ